MNTALLEPLRALGIHDSRILDAFSSTPREQFVPRQFDRSADADIALPIGHDQYLLPAKDDARLLQALDILPTDRVLEIGTGTGFTTYLLSQLASQVTSIDCFSDFTHKARQKLHALHAENATFITADATTPLPTTDTFDVLLVSAAVREIPKHWFSHLTVHGRIVAFVGSATLQQARCYRPSGKHWHHEALFETTIPMMIQPALPTFEF